ncbi:MAG: O-antigen ligase family protein [Planctomycetia bacterium]|nr:O-antigen ligase family protein [Planctomycetia bacterium]
MPPAADGLRPWLLGAVAMLAVARPLLASEGSAASGDSLLFQLAVLVLAAAWALRAATRRCACARWGLVDLAVLALVACYGASAVAALRAGAPRPALNATWEWVALAVGFFLVRQLVRSEREARALTATMIALAVAMSAYGFHQFFVSMPADRELYARNPEEALRQARVVAPEGSRQRILFAQRVNSTEPIATFALTNSLAGFLTPWLTVALGICGAAWVLRGRAWFRWVPAVVCAVVILGCLVLTKSRAAYVATAAGALLLVTWAAVGGARIRWWWFAAAAALLALVAAGAVGIGAVDRQVLTEAGKSLGYRWQYWQATWAMIGDHPWLGCGPGQFQTHYTAYKLPEASETVADPHNFLLEVWATAGTPAAIALLMLIGFVAWRGCRATAAGAVAAVSDAAGPSSPDAAPHVLAGGLAGFLFAYAVGPLTSVPLSIDALAGGLLVAAVATAGLWPWVRGGRMPVAVPAIAAAAILINLFAAGGISFAGVAGSLWLLAALCLVAVEPWRAFPRPAAISALAVILTLVVLFYTTTYSPVIGCRIALDRADVDPQRASALLEEAATADPLAAEPWRRMAALAWLQWQKHPSDATFDRFVACVDEALALDPNSAALAEFKGDAAFQAYKRSGTPAQLQTATAAYERAIDRYPTNILGHAKLALALAAGDDEQLASQHAAEALRLNDLTPHADLKLPQDVLERVEALAAGGPN